MKLVIDIPEEDYKSACKREFSMDGSMMIYNAIREGTEYKEQPHGEWLPCKDDNFCKCSQCGVIVMNEEAEDFDYCPKCGSDNRMREGE